MKINKFEKKRTKSNQNWSCIYWLKPDILLSSSVKHELYSVNFLSESVYTRLVKINIIGIMEKLFASPCKNVHIPEFANDCFKYIFSVAVLVHNNNNGSNKSSNYQSI